MYFFPPPAFGIVFGCPAAVCIALPADWGMLAGGEGGGSGVDDGGFQTVAVGPPIKLSGCAPRWNCGADAARGRQRAL